jgi:hypothetical protein
MTNQYPDDPDAARQPMYDARLHLMDRQMIDIDKVPVAAVDDIEFTEPSTDGVLPRDEPAPEIIALVTGLSLATRIFGGRPPQHRLHRIRWGDVNKIAVVIQLKARADHLDATWTERWVRDRIITKIPGGRHDPE